MTSPMYGLIRRYVPSSVGRALRRASWLPGDAWRRVRGGAAAADPAGDDLRLPRGWDFVGGGDFQAQGDLHLRFFVDLGGLTPDDAVLDVGCGIGRMAVPLTHYLGPAGGYRGFDIVPQGIAWCQQHITPRYPAFQFELADIRNRTYNPRGRLAARDYVFPYADAAFDFQLSVSVFTHMLADDVTHYVAQIARVLKPGAHCLNTFFLLTDEAWQLVRTGAGTQDFRYPIGPAWAVSKVEPEKAIAYPEEWVRALFAAHGLEVVEPVHYGSWCGRDPFVAYQDMVVARRL
jgi:SAM-dependent methyltransferase